MSQRQYVFGLSVCQCVPAYSIFRPACRRLKLLSCQCFFVFLDDFRLVFKCLFIYPSKQRVKIGDVRSGWVTLHGGIPQGSWLGPLVFLILTDNLRLQLPTHKYADDTTIANNS